MFKHLTVILLVFVGMNEVTSNQALRSMTLSFLKVLGDCRRELQVGENVLVDMIYFWKKERELMYRETGCVLVCMSKKLNLVDETGKIHHENAKDFALRHGAVDDMAMKLVTTVHECEKTHAAEEDMCLRALEVAKCFRIAMHEVNWAPEVDIAMVEILTEV